MNGQIGNVLQRRHIVTFHGVQGGFDGFFSDLVDVVPPLTPSELRENVSKTGPYISEIRLLTPLAQVVEVSQITAGIYSAQQAQRDYRARGDSILMEIHIEFTPTYSQIDAQRSSGNTTGEKGITLRTDDFWQDFRFGIKQKQDWIMPRSTHGEPQYALADGYAAFGGLIGAWVWVEYDASNVPSDDTEVHVVNPDGQGRIRQV